MILESARSFQIRWQRFFCFYPRHLLPVWRWCLTRLRSWRCHLFCRTNREKIVLARRRRLIICSECSQVEPFSFAIILNIHEGQSKGVNVILSTAPQLFYLLLTAHHCSPRHWEQSFVQWGWMSNDGLSRRCLIAKKNPTTKTAKKQTKNKKIQNKTKQKKKKKTTTTNQPTKLLHK